MRIGAIHVTKNDFTSLFEAFKQSIVTRISKVLRVRILLSESGACIVQAGSCVTYPNASRVAFSYLGFLKHLITI